MEAERFVAMAKKICNRRWSPVIYCYGEILRFILARVVCQKTARPSQSALTPGEENGECIWCDLNNGRCAVRRKAERQTNTGYGRLRRNRRGDRPVARRPWSACSGSGAGFEEGR